MENSILQEQSLSRSQPAAQPSDLVALLSQKVVGQSAATKAIFQIAWCLDVRGHAPRRRTLPWGESGVLLQFFKATKDQKCCPNILRLQLNC